MPGAPRGGTADSLATAVTKVRAAGYAVEYAWEQPRPAALRRLGAIFGSLPMSVRRIYALGDGMLLRIHHQEDRSRKIDIVLISAGEALKSAYAGRADIARVAGVWCSVRSDGRIEAQNASGEREEIAPDIETLFFRVAINLIRVNDPRYWLGRRGLLPSEPAAGDASVPFAGSGGR